MPVGASQLISLLRLPGGEPVTLRPVCPRDAGRMQDYVRALSPSARYDRFLGPVSEVSPAELDRMTRGDDRQMTLIAETKVDGVRTTIGEARYAVALDGSSCEIAVSVADAWRARGLGTRLLHHLECGFAMSGVPADARLVRIVKDIADVPAAAPCAEPAAPGMLIAA
jgi:acetyltransferase